MEYTEISSNNKFAFGAYVIITLLLFILSACLGRHEMSSLLNNWSRLLAATSGLCSAWFWIAAAADDSKKLHNCVAAALSGSSVMFSAVNIPADWHTINAWLGVVLFALGLILNIALVVGIFFKRYRGLIIAKIK
ncbi:hypothetical protein [Acetobacter orientalis]|uniref:Uncharacterized protein n=1 Tax=Acetobacter orientalis TaxID=146474 RepID=A0A0D6NLJ9_9PROT|nr:hypothetical protein [Acetobacter orientalis]GAN66924.1 hypothetical protein Abor_031_090 [Acetobacter orientalis]GBR14194.1 hypothetical protein AA0481_0549 [Acetobacter orientalis NRIC 0481]GEL60831.1 hypothetical protein AOR02nite_06730 [Acetobacter orientalis]